MIRVYSQRIMRCLPLFGTVQHQSSGLSILNLRLATFDAVSIDDCLPFKKVRGVMLCLYARLGAGSISHRYISIF